jgi:hypothetical protein
MEAVGIVAAVAALFTAIGVVFAVLGLRGLQRTRRFVAASASATGTVTDSVGRWYRDPGGGPGVSRLSHPVVRFVTGDDEDELSGTYRLAAEISVDRGEARVYSYDADGERFPLGTVSAGAPLRVDEVVIEPFNESSVFFINAGEGEIEDLR